MIFPYITNIALQLFFYKLKYKKIHVPFFRSSGFPFFTEATNISPAVADGNLFSLPLIPLTAITNRFFAPVLSAQFITAPTGSARDMRNFPPTRPPAKNEV